jgi:glyoxylase I family protein
MTAFPGIGHVAITVSDLSRSVPWYRALFGAEPVIDEDTGTFHHTVFLVGGTLVGLHGFPGGVPAGDAFEPRRLGLDHVAFGVADRSELATWAKRLDDMGIDHGEIVDASYGSGLAFRDPDGIALEFFAPPS